MKKIALLFIVLVTQQLTFSQQGKYDTFIQTWNFLKYYHPDLASGKIDADSLFLENIQHITTFKNSNAIIEALTQNLNNSFSKPIVKDDTEDIIRWNQNFTWYSRHKKISKHNRLLLQTIYNHRWISENHHYIPNLGYEGMIPNEKEYDFSKEENLPLAYRLLTVAKIRGCIDYLFPHKYLMSPSSDSLITQLTVETISCASRKEFEIILAKLVSTIEDTHAFSLYKQLVYKKSIFHQSFYAPFDFKLVGDYLLVTHLILPQECMDAHIQVGDKITVVNGRKIPELIQEKKTLLSASNENVLRYRLSDYQNNLIWGDDIQQKIITLQQKDHKNIQTTIDFIDPSEKDKLEQVIAYLTLKIQDQKEHHLKDTTLAYFKINEVYALIADVADDKIENTMESVLQEAFNKKTLVFDMRGYPDWGGFIYHYIYNYFSTPENYFAKYYEQNHSNVGTFVYSNLQETYFPTLPDKTTHPYKGQVFILVNEETLSASEWYTMDLQNIFPNAITLGQQTAGADGDVKRMTFPGKYILEFTGNGIFYPDGQPAQKTGIKIDRIIKYNNEDYIKKRDLEFEEILKHVK